MVNIKDLPKDGGKEPSKSVIVINDDRVNIYLFADGFSGVNYQVGYLDIQNIFIRDDRENPYMDALKARLFQIGNDFVEFMENKLNNLDIDPETFDIAKLLVIPEYNEFIATQLGVK